MKIVVLQPSYKDSTSEIAALDFKRDLSPWIPKDCEVEHFFLDKPSVNISIRKLKADVFINLCDGAWDQDTPGIDVVLALEREKRAFTGAGHLFYDPTKEEMKKVFYSWGIPTPAHVFAYDEDGINRAQNFLKLPCIVKHHHGYSSIGMTNESCVTTYEALRKMTQKMIDVYGGALVEEFIAGREFSVLISSNPDNEQEPFLYQPVECIFENGLTFKTFDHKWNTEDNPKNPWTPVLDRELAVRLQNITKTAYTAFKGTGYARSDIRMDESGNLFLLELNPNCSVFYPDDNGSTADVILQNDPVGKSGFLQRMIDYAISRKNKNTRKFIVNLTESVGAGMFANQDIKEGEVILKYEETPHILVTQQYVEKFWSDFDKDLFRHYAYPITDDLYIIWSNDPNEWAPINHSCDPNSWVTGLDHVARRFIQKGEQITMDYATMYTKDMIGFNCLCGEKLCRGGWKGDDYLQGWFIERYGDHVTNYILQKRKAKMKEVANF